MQLYITLWIKYHIQQCRSINQKSKICKMSKSKDQLNINSIQSVCNLVWYISFPCALADDMLNI